jgi:DNA-binding LacI/PurR family transcriptional regulator
MQEVADRVNVSISTVSFVVNNTKPVAPETRRKVLQAIDELGYRRNAMARALASRRSRILCLMFPLMQHDLSGFVAAATTAAAELGYNLVLWPKHNHDAALDVTSVIEAGIADGVLLLEVQLDDERVTRLRAAGAPFALIGRTRDTSGIDYVDIDFEGTTRQSVEELTRRGHRHLALVLEDLDGTPLVGYAPLTRVEQAFHDIVEERGLVGRVFKVPDTESPHSGLLDLLARDAPETTAIVGMHDTAIARLMTSMRHRGLRVPEDLSIIAVESTSVIAPLLDPPLTRYAAPGGDLGRRAAEALIGRLEGRTGPPTQLLLPSSLHEGATLAGAPIRRAPLDQLVGDIPPNPDGGGTEQVLADVAAGHE